MSKSSEHDYVLGTHDAEVERLGLQHRVWRETMLAGWTRAGFGAGDNVLDVGAGPGYATLDLAEVVGPTGHVLAIERSTRFLAVLQERCRAQRLEQVRTIEADLMDVPAQSGFDRAWCRWVAAFVPSPARLVQWMHHAVRPGGTVIFHEYGDYASWRFGPRRLRVEEFVASVIRHWRASGGEPDIGLELPQLLESAGFRVRSVLPLVFVAHPGDDVWRWPASFVHVNLERQLEQKQATPEWAAQVKAELAAAEADPRSLMITPLVLEVIAERV